MPKGRDRIIADTLRLVSTLARKMGDIRPIALCADVNGEKWRAEVVRVGDQAEDLLAELEALAK